MKVLVTGATGFIGREICNELIKTNYEIIKVGSKNKSSGKLSSGKIYRVNISDSEDFQLLKQLDNIEVIIHTAGLAHQFGKTKREDFFSVNVQGTENVCNLGAALKVKHFILISSVAVYGGVNKNQKGITEGIDCAPKGFYAESKYESEITARKICLENKIPLTILRPATVIGEEDVGNVARLIKAIDKKRFIFIGKGNNSKSLIYKKDVAKACEAVLIKKTNETEVFNVSAEPLKMNEIVSIITSNLGKRSPKLYISERLSKNVLGMVLKFSNFSKFQNLLKTIEKWVAEDVYNSEKIKRIYNFEPETPVSEAIALEVNWYKNKK